MKKILLILLSILICTSCEYKVWDHITDADTFYDYEGVIDDFSGLENPKGMEVLDENLYIINGKNKSIMVYDKGFKLLNELKPEGLDDPVDLSYEDGKFYFLDGFQQVCKVYDSDFNHIEDLHLAEINNKSNQYSYIEVLDGKIYYAPISADIRDSNIYMYDNGENYIIKDAFLGNIKKLDGSLYAIETLEHYTEPGESGFQTGKSNIYKIVGKDIKKVQELNRMNPEGMYMVDGDFIVFAGGIRSILRLKPGDTEFVRIVKDTIFIKNPGQNEYLYVEKFGDKLIISNSFDPGLFSLTLK